VVFRRIDLSHPVDIPVSATAVTDTRLASTISSQGVKVHTVEHLMSAWFWAGYRQFVRRHHGRRSSHFGWIVCIICFLLQSAGIALQDAPKRFIRLLSEISVAEGEAENKKWAKIVGLLNAWLQVEFRDRLSTPGSRCHRSTCRVRYRGG
jgi:UDP-3-O-[3-hydroxymyristoyl] N-acetylglucosamine deacetylase